MYYYTTEASQEKEEKEKRAEVSKFCWYLIQVSFSARCENYLKNLFLNNDNARTHQTNEDCDATKPRTYSILLKRLLFYLLTIFFAEPNLCIVCGFTSTSVSRANTVHVVHTKCEQDIKTQVN